jgi:CO dehydrogenase maturation factor
MKYAISGKGGTGKTTVAALLAHAFNRDGNKVLAVDADPDANLATALGISEQQAAAITPISKQRQLIQERTGAIPGKFGQFFKINPTVADIPEKFCSEFKGIKILVLGAIQQGGKGCACPENVILQNLLSEIILNRHEMVIVDMEAGIEHLGRATARSIDKMLVIIEPGSRSIATARTIKKMASEIGIQSFGFIANKVRNIEQQKWITRQFPSEEILGIISYNKIIQDSDINQKPLIETWDNKLKKEFNLIYKNLCKP